MAITGDYQPNNSQAWNLSPQWQVDALLHRMELTEARLSALGERQKPSQERPVTTASPTTDSLSDVLDRALTALTVSLSLRVRGVLTDQERIHVEQCSACADQLARSLSQLSTHALGVDGRTSTSARAASPSYVAHSTSDAAKSRLSGSSSQDKEAEEGNG